MPRVQVAGFPLSWAGPRVINETTPPLLYIAFRVYLPVVETYYIYIIIIMIHVYAIPPNNAANSKLYFPWTIQMDTIKKWLFHLESCSTLLFSFGQVCKFALVLITVLVFNWQSQCPVKLLDAPLTLNIANFRLPARQWNWSHLQKTSVRRTKTQMIVRTL